MQLAGTAEVEFEPQIGILVAPLTEPMRLAAHDDQKTS